MDVNLLQELKEKLTGIFAKDTRVVAAYLFGSYADGSAHCTSDLDIGIAIDPCVQSEFTLEDEIDLELKIESILRGKKCDLVVINKVPLNLQFRIISPAKTIYIGNDDLRCEIEERIMLNYYDFLPRLRQFNKDYFSALQEEYVK